MRAMKISAEPTAILTKIDGIPVRLWTARTESGVAFIMFVHRCVVPKEADNAEFEAGLRELPQARELSLPEVFDLRLF